MKWTGYFLATLMLISIGSTVIIQSAYSQSAEEKPIAMGFITGFVYVRYYIFCYGVPWAKVHFIAEDGTEYLTYSNGGGAYITQIPLGNYTAYAEYGWYKSEEFDIIVGRGNTPYNFIIEVQYSRSGRPTNP